MAIKFNVFKHIFFLVSLSCIVFSMQAQEYLTGVDYNISVGNYSIDEYRVAHKRSSIVLELPFFDDFSGLNIYPDPLKWVDFSVYVNDDYAINQPTIGVATFDAIDNWGYLYPFSDTASVMPGDTLTSQYINLAGLKPSDSVYISFFVQSGGYGNLPQPKDSIILQFMDSLSGQWKTVWRKAGDTLTRFEPVIVPIINQKFLHDSAQFRFRNYFSLEYSAMNCDHWNIDYIMLDKGRSVYDSLIDEVAYTKNVNRLLKIYSSVPWSHFKIYYSQIVDRVVYQFRNYTENVMNITPYLRWTNLYTNEVKDIGNIANNYAPNTSFFIEKSINNSLFTIDELDSARFEVQNRFYMSENDFQLNNRTKRIVDFYNYYAYDDGTAEGMYGVSNKYGMVAVKYEVFRTDSLKAVRIFFNKSQNGENRYFNIKVWDDGGSGPGEVLYTKTRNLPAYADTINGFVTIEFDSAVAVDKTFYVGWEKITDQRLNMGFDKNFVAYQRNYFNANGKWELSQYNGSLMIRPVLGDMLSYRDSFWIPEEEQELETHSYVLYPNPVGNDKTLYIRSVMAVENVYIYNQIGQLVVQNANVDHVDLSPLNSGIYIVRISDGQKFYSYKIIIK